MILPDAGVLGVFDAEDSLALRQIAFPDRAMPANRQIIDEDTSSDLLFMLLRGWGYKYKTGKDGRRQIIGFLLPGDACNLNSVFDANLNYGVCAATPAAVISFSRTQIIKLARDRPSLGLTLAKLFAVENAALIERIFSLGRENARDRLIRLLCEMAVRQGLANKLDAIIELPISQELMAESLGMTSVHINRMAAELRIEGLATLRIGHVIVPRLPALFASIAFDGRYLDYKVGDTNGLDGARA